MNKSLMALEEHGGGGVNDDSFHFWVNYTFKGLELAVKFSKW